MTEREKLIEELGNLVKKHSNSGISHKLSYTMKRWELELVAEFIVGDRKRIVMPIFSHKLSVIETEQSWGLRNSDRYINETLKLAGIE